MKKIIVIGCPGSGKSTFSRKLHGKIGIPLYHLDIMYWNEDKTIVEKSLFRQRLSEVIEKDEWIVDGNYGSTMEMRMAACDTVFFLDFSVDVCLDGIRERMGKPRSDMPWVETAEDPEFVEYIKNFNIQSKPRIAELLDKYKEERTVVIFKSREDADGYIDRMEDKL